MSREQTTVLKPLTADSLIQVYYATFVGVGRTDHVKATLQQYANKPKMQHTNFVQYDP